MFSPSGLFRSLQCPALSECTRNPCPFSHSQSSTRLSSATIPASHPVPSTSISTPLTTSTTSSKRPGGSSILSDASTEPPRKVQVVASQGVMISRSTKVSSPTSSPAPKPKLPKPAPVASAGPPSLNASPASSKIPIRDRQQMLTTLYEQFRTLYTSILPRNPTLATEHALAQEIDVYNKSGSNKMIYRNGMISMIASLKKRPPPTSLHHPSIGTESQVQARKAALKEYENLRLTPEHLQDSLLTVEQMKTWGYVVEIPDDWGAGGENINQVGNDKKCDRCGQHFTVRVNSEPEECQFHWGRPYVTKNGGVKERIYRCCSEVHPSVGCQKGVHVFYESEPQALHSQHPFSPSSQYTTNHPSAKQFDIVALDCEMIYTTAGMSVARVSVVDELGNCVFDEFVLPDDNVHVLDYNTRFSGIESLEKASLDLNGIRRSLAAIIGPQTIIIGHAAENDLRTLRMLHLRVIDTVALFPHRCGPPARRALREIVLETLGQTIQKGSSSSGEGSASTIGHSSLEDARATLNLVRWWVTQKQTRSS